MTGFLGFDGPGTANTAPHSDHPALVGAISPVTYGAKLDGVTDDTLAWNEAIAAAHQTGANLLMPVARSVIAGTVNLLPNTWISGLLPGPFDVGANPAASVIAPTFLITNPSTSPFTFASRNSGIQDVLIHYPNQTLPNSNIVTAYPATFSTPAGSSGIHFRRITLTNAYQGFNLLGGRHFLDTINAGCLSNVATVDNSLDLIHFNRVVASPFWDNAASLNYPQSLDTWVAANRTDYIFYRADSHVMTDCFGFAGNIGMQLLDSGLPLGTLNSYGKATNIEFDTYTNGVVAQSTRNVGWSFDNLFVGSSSNPIVMQAGGGSAPVVRVNGGSFYGANKAVDNTAGGCVIQGVIGAQPLGNSGVGTPGVPLSTGVVANPNPFACLVAITAGASTCAIGIGPGQPTALTLPSNGVGSIVVAANQGVKLTYTSAPTWVWFGLG